MKRRRSGIVGAGGRWRRGAIARFADADASSWLVGLVVDIQEQ